MSKIMPLTSSEPPQAFFRLVDQATAVFGLDPAVSRNAQQRDSHIERRPAGDRPKGAVAVREVAGIFPEKVADERLGGVLVAGGAHEEMFQFSGDAAGIENAICALGSFQIERDDLQPIAEHKIVRRRVAVHDHLLVFPHPRLIAPLVAQPVQLACFVPSDRAGFRSSLLIRRSI